MFNYNLQSQEGFNEVFDQIENAIYNTALQCRISRKLLKDNKTSADGWIPRMITAISGTLFGILLVLFNIILQCALYPTRWRTRMVAAIFKNKGSHLSAKFYRPVPLVVLLSKLFDFILLKRFQNWFLPHDCQSAYQPGKSCAEHVFLIRALIQHSIKSKQKLFIVCVDFEGALSQYICIQIASSIKKRQTTHTI